MPRYSVYIIRCADETLYTGVTTDIKRRFAEHRSGVGAKYTRAHGAVAIVYQRDAGSRSLAQKREAEIKKMTRIAKLELIAKSKK